MKLAFLVYFSRSGSTYLANQLAHSSSDLVVLPETELVSILTAYPPAQERGLNEREIVELLRLDEHLPTWDLPDGFIESVASQCDGGGPIAILQRVATGFAEATGRSDATHALFQRGNILNSYERLNQFSSDLKLICLHRDPRASISSLLKIAETNFTRYDKQRMGRNDAIGLALRWKRYYQIARQVCESYAEQSMSVCYEDLCRELPGTLAKILKHVGVPLRPADDSPFVVSATDLEIHSKINQSPDLERLEAWKTEIDLYRGRIVESILRQELQIYGYSPYFTTMKDHFIRGVASWITQGFRFLLSETQVRIGRWRNAFVSSATARRIARIDTLK